MEKICLSVLIGCVSVSAVLAQESGHYPGLSDIPNVTIKYYDIAGATVGEIRKQLDGRGRWGAGLDEHTVAYTTAAVNWSVRTSGKSPCRIISSSVHYEIVVTLPRLANSREVSPATAKKWAAFMSAVTKHEREHALINSQLEDLNGELRSASCESVSDVAKRFLDKLETQNDAYDRETDHGKAQGIVF